MANYERLLRRRGYRVIAAGSRAEGLTLVEREPLSLLITDLRLSDGDVRPHESDAEVRVGRLESLRYPGVALQGRGAGVDDTEVVAGGSGHHIVNAQAGRGGIDELAARDQGRRLSQPGGIPEGSDFAACLVARARPPVETLEGRRVQQESLEHGVPPWNAARQSTNAANMPHW